LGHIAQTASVLGVCPDFQIKLLRQNPALSLCFGIFIFAILDLMPATLKKINVHAMLKWVIQLIERELNALERKKKCDLSVQQVAPW